MKMSLSTDSPIMDALKRVESGISPPDICRELGIELPFDSRIPTVEQKIAIPEGIDQADFEGEIHRGVEGGCGAVDRHGSSAGRSGALDRCGRADFAQLAQSAQ
jgi:hypothetical protein